MTETTPNMVTTKGIETESDVEQKVILPLLTGGSYLEIPLQHIKTKKYLQPAQLDKKAGKRSGYFPDFSIWEKSFPLLIVEAKSPDIEAEVGYREAALYARHVNSGYKTGVNPCTFIMSCNGRRLLVGRWDAQPDIDIACKDIADGNGGVHAVREYCHYHTIAAHAFECLDKTRVRKFS